MAFLRRIAYTSEWPNTSGHWANQNAAAMENFGNYTPDTAQTIAPIDVTFTVPPSGVVWVLLSCDIHTNATGEHGYFGIHESGNLVTGSRKRVHSGGPNHKRRIQYTHIVGSLTPGASKTWTWVWEGGGADDVRSSVADDGFTRAYFEIYEVQ